MTDTILDLDNKEARKYFLKASSYCNFSLPTYFDFQPLLDRLSFSSEIPQHLPKNKKEKTYTYRFKDLEQDDVNYLMYTNKDGKLAWRPLGLINPAAYVYLANIITDRKSWSQIQARFKDFQKNENIKCCSIPIVKNNSPDKSETIKGWFEAFEKESIKLSLEYNCLLITDITNCYGSIYTHSIAWAIHSGGKIGAKKDKKINVYCAMLSILLSRIFPTVKQMEFHKEVFSWILLLKSF